MSDNPNTTDGTSADGAHQLGQSSESLESANANSDIRFFPVSEGKLITLYIASFGMYSIYWFYKNWQLQQTSMGKKISPVWRSIFSIFFTHALFRRIDQQAARLDKKHRFSANTLATLFVAAIIASNVLDQLTQLTQITQLTVSANMFGAVSLNSIIITSLILFFLSIYPLVKVQATVNRINNDMLGYLNHKYSFWNYLLIAIGVISWLLAALGILNEALT